MYNVDMKESENALLRKQVADLNAEIRRRDVAETKARIDRLNAEQAAADAAAKAAADAAAAAELEQHRRSAWVNRRLDEALGSADPDAAMVALLARPAKYFESDVVAPEGWPPGTGPDDFRITGVPDPAPDGEVSREFSKTLLGQVLAKGGKR